MTETDDSRTLSADEASASLTSRGLLDALDVDHLQAMQDEAYVVGKQQVLGRDAIASASRMLKTAQGRDLLGVPQSGLLLVQGHLHRARVSPISLVCGNLAQAFRHKGNAVLAFFCGLHLDDTDPLQGPEGLIRSLLSQLTLVLSQKQWIPEGPMISRPAKAYGGPDRLTLDDICRIFHGLLHHMRTGVLCIVDGISYFERDDWYREYHMVTTTLRQIVDDSSLPVPLKLLFTSPTTSTRLSFLPPQNQISLRNQWKEYGDDSARVFGSTMASAARGFA
jgi:hypothetical protein